MEILKFYGDSYIYEDVHKTLPRLNIAAHGVSPEEYPDARVVIIGDINYSPYELSILLWSFLSKKDYGSVRLVSCYSAMGGGESFAAELSRHPPGNAIKGYVGLIRSAENFLPPSVMNTIENIPLEEDANLRLWKAWHPDFHPCTYRNGQLIKETPYRSLT